MTPSSFAWLYRESSHDSCSLAPLGGPKQRTSGPPKMLKFFMWMLKSRMIHFALIWYHSYCNFETKILHIMLYLSKNPKLFFLVIQNKGPVSKKLVIFQVDVINQARPNFLWNWHYSFGFEITILLGMLYLSFFIKLFSPKKISKKLGKSSKVLVSKNLRKSSKLLVCKVAFFHVICQDTCSGEI